MTIICSFQLVCVNERCEGEVKELLLKNETMAAKIEVAEGLLREKEERIETAEFELISAEQRQSEIADALAERSKGAEELQVRCSSFLLVLAP